MTNLEEEGLGGDPSDLIDPTAVFNGNQPSRPSVLAEKDDRPEVARMPAKEYLDRYVNPPDYLEQQHKKLAEMSEKAKGFPPAPERDVLGFMMEHAPL